MGFKIIEVWEASKPVTFGDIDQYDFFLNKDGDLCQKKIVSDQSSCDYINAICWSDGAAGYSHYSDDHVVVPVDVEIRWSRKGYAGPTGGSNKNRSIDDIVLGIAEHHRRHPDHGVSCACMDEYVRELRLMTQFPGNRYVQDRIDMVMRQVIDGRR